MGDRTLGIFMVLLAVAASFAPWGAREQVDQGGAAAPAATAGDVGMEALDLAEALRSVDPSFTENLGQVADPDVRFYAQGDPLSVGLTRHGAVFTLRGPLEQGGSASFAPRPARVVSFSLTFVGSGGAGPRGATELGHRTNVLRGSDPAHWVSGAKGYGEVVYDGLYPGIGLRFHFRDGMLKYDLAVAPGADVDGILIQYHGLGDLAIDGGSGDLLLMTALGTLRDARPVVLQEGLGPGGSLPASFRLAGDGLVGFALPDACSRSLPLVIDPGLEFSTFIGGSEAEYGRAIALDAQGNLVIAGATFSADFPITPDAYKVSEATATLADFYVAKLNPTDSSLLWSTCVGGAGFDECLNIAVCGDGTIVCAGYTNSQDFPVANAFRQSNGPHEAGTDAVVLKLSADGTALPFSSVFGGEDDDAAVCVEALADGSLVVSGFTESSDFTTTAGAFCTTRDFIPDWDLFAVKINRSLKDLDYGTYLGGTGREGLSGSGIIELDMAVDDSGKTYLLSQTSSNDFPITPGANKSVKNTTDVDAVVAILDPTGSTLLRSTLFGGWGGEDAFAIRVSQNGSVHIGGVTSSVNLNVTDDALVKERPSASSGFLAILDPDLTMLQYCTYVGGGDANFTYVQAMSWGPDEEMLYVLCITNWDSWATTKGTFDPKYRGSADYILLGLRTDNRSVEYATYIGGASSEGDYENGKEMVIDGSGVLYLVGSTHSEDFPTTPGALDTVMNGSSDAVVVRLDPRPCTQPPPVPRNFTAVPGDDVVRLKWDVPIPLGSRVTSHRIYWGLSATDLRNKILVTKSDHAYTHFEAMNGNEYFYQISAVNDAGEGPRSAIVKAKPLGVPSEPLLFKAVNVDGVIHLNWTPPAEDGGELGGYHVLKEWQGASPRILAVGPGVTSYNDTDVDVGVKYTYRVRANNTLCNGTWTDPIEVTPMTVPTAPLDLVATGGDRSVELLWKAPTLDGSSPITSFLVYGGASVDNLALIGSTPRVYHNFTVLGLENTVTYYFCAYARNAIGTGPPSATVAAVPRGAPLVPRGLVATAGDGLILLSWEPPLSDGGYNITGYRIYVGTDQLNLKLATTTKAVTSYTLTGLTNGVTYYVQVLAINGFGPGPRTEPQHASPGGLPGVVQNIIALDGVRRTKLIWQLPTTTGGMPITELRVYRGEDPGELAMYKNVSAGSTEFADFEVVLGSTYYYAVTACTVIGEGPRSETVSAMAFSVAGPPTDLVATAGDGRVTLRWDPPEDDGGRPVQGYTLYRGDSPGPSNVLVELSTVVTYVDNEVVNGKEYFYCIKSANEAGIGSASETVSATPSKPFDVPGTPTSFKVSVEGTVAVLTWGPPASDGGSPVTGYVILRGTVAGNMSVVAEVGPILSYSQGGLDRGTVYYYTVVAKNAAGQGAKATAAMVKVPEKKAESPGFAACAALMALTGVAAYVATSRRSRRA